eukprot:CAMPEP_0168548710 /NCGR_PEP_ID=MMETSP0413-20121227/4713_1 /TAXON_ID=136452 /ORGANISM="Filamoeba nolandi, Strain NC-AS-23-1" /LENGTH=418 /DNA_ID=CAMNT_0008579045 /DNA_START=31 /DNA_END=1284 /DNA_ORIENTATION=+
MTSAKLLVVLVFANILLGIHCESVVDDTISWVPLLGATQTRTLGGHILVNELSGGYLYYFLTESQSNPATDPLIIWLQGGPGSSSMFGCFVENGPYLIQPNGSFVDNPYAWNARANVMWIDNPVGTGYSYVKDSSGYATDEWQIARQLVHFLSSFFKTHPEYSTLDLYLFGESYAGKYVPWFAATMLQTSTNPPFNLKGIGLGNGWVSPYWQAGSYAPFLQQNNRINASVAAKANEIYQEYVSYLEQQDYYTALELDGELFDYLCVNSNPPVTNYYDIRKVDDPTTPPEQVMNQWLNSTPTALSMNANNAIFDSGDIAYYSLDEDEEKSALFLLPILLHKGIKVMLYNGQYDLICNWLGTYSYAVEIDWQYKHEFNTAPEQSWYLNGQKVGHYIKAENLLFVVVYDAGHMSPFDQPES